MNISLDGFLSGPDGALDWHFQCWSPDMAESLGIQLSGASTILLGRKTYLAMAPCWQPCIGGLSGSRHDIAIAEMMDRYTKIVVSGSLIRPPWPRSIIMNGDIRQELLQLKRQAGKNIVVYGSGSLVSALLRLGLIDEYQLYVHPVAIGAGKALFGGLAGAQRMKLTDVTTFSSGVVLLVYQCSGQSSG
jgi:dihydrofolate reductase